MKKYFLYIFGIIIIAIIAFCTLEPLKQAKLFLSAAGVHRNIAKKFDHSLSLIIENKYKKYNSLKELPSYHFKLLEKYHYPDSNLNANSTKLYKVYASEGEEWELTDNIVDSSLPRMKFEYAYCSDRSMILVVKAGGIAVTTPYTFYEIRNDEFVLKSLVSFYDNNIFLMALNLKFNKGDSVFMPEDLKSLLPNEVEN